MSSVSLWPATTSVHTLNSTHGASLLVVSCVKSRLTLTGQLDKMFSKTKHSDCCHTCPLNMYMTSESTHQQGELQIIAHSKIMKIVPRLHRGCKLVSEHTFAKLNPLKLDLPRLPSAQGNGLQAYQERQTKDMCSWVLYIPKHHTHKPIENTQYTTSFRLVTVHSHPPPPYNLKPTNIFPLKKTKQKHSLGKKYVPWNKAQKNHPLSDI